MKRKMDKQPTNSKKPNQSNSFIRFSGIAIQMVVIIYLGNLLGIYLDQKYETANEVFTKVVTLTAVFLSIFLVIRQVIAATSDK